MELIHHYTTAQGLLGIVNEEKMWFTDILYLNDASEVSYGLEVCRDAAVAILTELGANQWQIQAIVGNMNSEPPEHGLNTYVACFCGKHDLLSQWRGYGASGVGGYCLSFDKSAIEEIGTHPDRRRESQSFTQKTIIYSPVRQGATARNNTAFQGFLRNTLNAPTGEVDPHWQETTNHLALELSGFFKSPGFAEEDETRLVIGGNEARVNASTIQFRCSANGLVLPYLSAYLAHEGKKMPLVAVKVGPSANPELAVQSVHRMLALRGYDEVEVTKSNVTLRTL